MSKRSQKNQQRADKRYHARVAEKGNLTRVECSRYSGFSTRHIDNLASAGALKFTKIGGSEKIPFVEFDAFMPGGGEAWMSADGTAAATGHTKRQLERLRQRGGGPEWKKFGAKLLRYRRASVASYNQAASSPKKPD